MKRKPQSPADGASGIEQLVEKLAGVEEELAAIRQTLDAIRDDLAWWLNNNRSDEWQPIQPITSLPSDPLATDWPQRVNKLNAGDLSDISAAVPSKPTGSTAPPRVAPDVIDDEKQFCCEAPNLQWTGDARLPGVACQNCGYVVADCGSVAMYPASESGADLKPKEQQRALFDQE